jgi:hypothetical protein
MSWTDPEISWTPERRAAAFWGLCLPLRTLFALLAIRRAPSAPIATAQAAVGVTQLALFVRDGRLDAPEGGGVTWWAPYRVLVGLAFLAAAAVTAKGVAPPYHLVPLLDPVLGAAVWLAARPD